MSNHDHPCPNCGVDLREYGHQVHLGAPEVCRACGKTVQRSRRLDYDTADQRAVNKARDTEGGEAINPKDILGLSKPSLTKIPPSALVHEALAMMDGDKKYGAYNWRSKKVIASVYVDACQRHILAWFDGEEKARDSGIHHLGHARACLGILIDAQQGGNLKDDRPPPGSFADLIALFTEEKP